MPGRVLIVAPQIAPESLPWRSIAEAARTGGLEAEWLAPVASENALRARLAAGDVRLIVLIGHGQHPDHAVDTLRRGAFRDGLEPHSFAARLLGRGLVDRDTNPRRQCGRSGIPNGVVRSQRSDHQSAGG